MDKLTAVNILLRAIGEPRAPSLDTGGTSDIAEAESILDERCTQVLSTGWWVNHIPSFEARPGLVRLTVTGTSGDFIYDEAITVGTKTGRYCYSDGSYIYINPDAGQTFATGTLTGVDSAATRTVTAVATSTTGKIATGSDWIHVEASETAGERRRVTAVGGYLRNTDAASVQFDSNVFVRLIVAIDFDDLPEVLQRYIADAAAIDFQQYMKRGQVDDAMLKQRLLESRTAAMQANDDQKDLNVFNSRDSRRIRGYRDSLTSSYRANPDYGYEG